MFPTQIILRNLRPATGLGTHVRDMCEKLAYLHPNILNCRVSIEQPLVKTRRRAPPPAPFVVDVQVRLPDRMLGGGPQENAELESALRKAFTVVRRQLREAHDLERGLVRRVRSRDSDRPAPAPARPACW